MSLQVHKCVCHSQKIKMIGCLKIQTSILDSKKKRKEKKRTSTHFIHPQHIHFHSFIHPSGSPTTFHPLTTYSPLSLSCQHQRYTLQENGWSELAPTNAPVADEPVEAVFWMDENPILPARFFFFFSHLFSTPKFYPVLPTTYLPPPTYHLPPPVLPTTYLPPPTYHLPTPPPLTPSPEFQRPRAAGELERLERELELWLWSWSGWSAHEKVRTLLHFLACFAAALLCRNTASSGARLRSFATRCFAARCVAASSGARLRSLLRVALLQRSKLRSLAPELCCALLCCALLCYNAASSGARLRSFAAPCFAAPGSGALLRVALLRLWSFAARCFAVAPELCCALLCCN